MTNDEARRYFRDKGLTYRKLRRYDVDLLKGYIGHELARYAKTDDIRRIDDYRVCKRVHFHGTKSGRLQYAAIRVSGSYFKHREAVTFNGDGFIGFCGWASDYNAEPILTAFCKWCDYVSAALEAER